MPFGHQVLGQVRVGVLVDRVRDAVAPVLQELGRRARVIDLVEVHAVGLLDAEGAQAERGHEDDHQQQQVEPVEPARALADQLGAAVAADRYQRRQTGAQEAAHVIAQATTLLPSPRRRRAAPCGQPARDTGLARSVDAPVGSQRRLRSAAASGGRRPQLQRDQHERRGVQQDAEHDRHRLTEQLAQRQVLEVGRWRTAAWSGRRAG